MRVAIIDDVMTSGATLNELARNVKRAGAVHVSAWVIARTLRA
jgi:predicted amidophosphoribosyltransferase